MRYVDGEGQIVYAGGKVVKNAAGFDIPKLMVGSLGQFGVLVEMTFKVFPKPEANATLRLDCASVVDGVNAIIRLTGQPLDLDAVDLEATATGGTLWVRLAGLADALPARIERLRGVLGGGDAMSGDQEAALWRDARELAWVPPGWSLVKAPVTPKKIARSGKRPRWAHHATALQRRRAGRVDRHAGAGAAGCGLVGQRTQRPGVARPGRAGPPRRAPRRAIRASREAGSRSAGSVHRALAGTGVRGQVRSETRLRPPFVIRPWSVVRRLRSSMQHAIAIETLGPQGPAMGHAIESCVHCGFCLPVCPTYQVLGEEMDSPRGRIVLMKSALEGNLTVDETLPYIDRCLGCQGCVTACPSGVQYGDLITAYRAHAEATRKRTLMVRVRRTLARETIPYPDRFRVAAVAGKLGKAFEGLVPSDLRGMLSLLPEKMPAAQPLPAFYPAEGTRRARRGAAGGLRPAGARAGVQLGDAARAGEERRRGRHPRGTAVLRRARHAPGGIRRGPQARPRQSARLSVGRGRDHHQRGGLRIGAARVSAALRRSVGGRTGRGAGAQIDGRDGLPR